ncbi:hypothetical protein J6590_055816 [Homalodisca vitripennis]|nr:hypothetical protein J6590_055816 [Homalodisca vitripennis]
MLISIIACQLESCSSSFQTINDDKSRTNDAWMEVISSCNQSGESWEIPYCEKHKVIHQTQNAISCDGKCSRRGELRQLRLIRDIILMERLHDSVRMLSAYVSFCADGLNYPTKANQSQIKETTAQMHYGLLNQLFWHYGGRLPLLSVWP